MVGRGSGRIVSNRQAVVLIILLQIFFLINNSFAYSLGKISGKIVDENNMPLPGVSVIVEGTHYGAATDLDGKYVILAVPAGEYNLLVSHVGYQSQRLEKVIVESGKTLNFSFNLKPQSVDLKPVTLTYSRPPLDLKETNQRIIVKGEVAEQLPLRTTNKLVAVQAGMVSDSEGEIHLRGGRSGEIAYFIDGQRVEDPLFGENLADISQDALKELSVLSGTFSAEYGDAMSGIVQIETSEGSEQFKSRVEYRTARLNASPYRKADWSGGSGDAVKDSLTGQSLYEKGEITDLVDPWVNVPGYLSLTLQGPVPSLKKTTFFSNFTNDLENSHLPFGGNWTRQFYGKMVSEIIPQGRLAFSAGINATDGQDYSHAWKYYYNNYHLKFLRSNRFNLSWTHNVSQKAYYTLNVGFFEQKSDRKIFEDWDDYLTSNYQPEDFTFANYFYGANDWSDVWRESYSKTLSTTFKSSWQVNNYHELISGFDYYNREISLDEYRQLEITDDGQRAGVHDGYDENPVEVAAYLQDKIEFDYLVINAGARLDYVDPRTEGWVDAENPSSDLEKVDPAWQISPRLGLAHPIRDNLTLHFAYGHFFQYPDYVSLFMNSADLNPDTLANRAFDPVGSRTLKPQKTVAYEVGLKGILVDDWGFTLTAFYKDITDLVGTRMVRVGTAYHYAAFVNIDYASVKGFEIGLNKRLSNHWSMTANYTWSVAKGNSAEPLTGYWDAYEGQPSAQQEYFLDFDRRHVTNLVFTWKNGQGDYPRLFGTSLLKETTAGVIIAYASGLPYTPYSEAGEQLALRNSDRMDGTFQADLKLQKSLSTGKLKVDLYTQIENIFDNINPLYVFSSTGKPWETNRLAGEIAHDQIHDPSRVDAPRIIRVGLALEY